ncbi:MAG: nucleoside phosphorylase [Syntrophobacterales bacterium]|nr:nucleoside phosphorylase [Syntrophobacterales bacterium]
MNRRFDPSRPVLSPHDIIYAFTKNLSDDLALPKRAIVTFNKGDLNYILSQSKGIPVEAWSRFRQIYRLNGFKTVITRSYFGGPNISALVEELAAFGVAEFVMWGYCGGIDPALAIGDILVATGALREDGVSFHYMEGNDAMVSSSWLNSWVTNARDEGFHSGTVWSCDAIYRETAGKVMRYRELGISGVEMETASFYSVCNYLGIRGIVFLVVSDLLTEDSWTPGFRTKSFRAGVKKLAQFILNQAIC